MEKKYGIHDVRNEEENLSVQAAIVTSQFFAIFWSIFYLLCHFCKHIIYEAFNAGWSYWYDLIYMHKHIYIYICLCLQIRSYQWDHPTS